MNNKVLRDKSITSYENIDSGVSLRGDTFHYDIIFYKADIVRIHQYRKGEEDTNPYAVVQGPGFGEVSIEELPEVGKLVLSTDAMRVNIDLTSFALSFCNADGTVIQAQETGLGIECQGTQKTVYNSLQPNEKFVGLGEKTGPLNKRGRGYQNWNTDSFAYHENQDPLYATIPFYIGIHDHGSYGVFLDNTYKSHFNFGASNHRFSSFSVDEGDIDYYVFAGSVENIIQSYSWLTGKMPLPPLWSLGYQQCRYSYYPESEVMSVAGKFREKEIPADVMVLDIHYMDKYKIFSWDKDRFPNPKQMIQNLKNMGFHVVVICDPGIKVEGGYDTYDSGIAQNAFLKYPDGENYQGQVWPGWCHFPDFTDENVRDWWTEMMKSYTDIGLKGFWNDMNEIATWGQMLPENIVCSFEGKGGTTLKGRNVYGMQMARSAYEAAKTNLDGERPFVLTRAAYSGIQRFSALWTGDNVASSGHMLLGTRLISNLGLSGVPYAGYDIGGFCGDSDGRLFARWQQVGTFAPFYRGHTMINSKDSEPWSFGEEVEEIAANYIRLRYKLMPYIYSAFLEASETGMPVARSLAIDYTNDEQVFNGAFENQYLFGRSILVAPIGSNDQFLKVYLPEGEWYDFFTDERFAGSAEIIREYALEELPLFVKCSSIIPIYPQANTNVFGTGEVLEMHIYKGRSKTTFDYYEDDGSTYDFEEGAYHRRKILFEPAERKLTLTKAEGSLTGKVPTLKLIFHGFAKDELLKITGMKKESYAFVKPISDFDPFEDPSKGKLKIKEVQTLTVDYTSEEMVYQW
ncbi:MAG: TIM-barrel domain-containing protein [Bacteroidota bacterium]